MKKKQLISAGEILKGVYARVVLETPEIKTVVVKRKDLKKLTGFDLTKKNSVKLAHTFSDLTSLVIVYHNDLFSVIQYTPSYEVSKERLKSLIEIQNSDSEAISTLVTNEVKSEGENYKYAD
jgi:hypothetical protein